MKLVTWNVNSVRARLERLLAVLKRHEPDVVCLQELKGVEDVFPLDDVRAAGYRAAVYGQKAYNGVAILSRAEPENVVRGFADGQEDESARLIAADIGKTRIITAYVPNGQSVGSEKWADRLDWMQRLLKYLEANCSPEQDLVLCGDLNVAVDDADAANPDQWAKSVLCHAEGRTALEAIRDWGFVDVFKRLNPDGGVYSWWDYRHLGFPNNDGLRIDHVYATESLAANATTAEVDRAERKGKGASDHAPVIVVFKDGH